jgi:hypothetical protein
MMAASDPPTEAELVVVFGSSPGQGFIGFVKDTSSGGSMWLVQFDGVTWWILEMTAAV